MRTAAAICFRGGRDLRLQTLAAAPEYSLRRSGVGEKIAGSKSVNFRGGASAPVSIEIGDADIDAITARIPRDATQPSSALTPFANLRHRDNLCSTARY
jgi:hypothetical protein